VLAEAERSSEKSRAAVAELEARLLAL